VHLEEALARGVGDDGTRLPNGLRVGWVERRMNELLSEAQRCVLRQQLRQQAKPVWFGLRPGPIAWPVPAATQQRISVAPDGRSVTYTDPAQAEAMLGPEVGLPRFTFAEALMRLRQKKRVRRASWPALHELILIGIARSQSPGVSTMRKVTKAGDCEYVPEQADILATDWEEVR
jgi:hypothetical protein